MKTPLLYRQLQAQLSQWVQPKDQRHLQGFAEIVAAVCFVWGGRSFTLAQVVLEHGSAMVGFEQYRPVLERAQQVLPPEVQVTLLADRGFEHGDLMR